MVAAATIRIMKIAQVTYLGALSHLNAILIPRISAHPPILPQCKVHRPRALFREGMIIFTLVPRVASYILLLQKANLMEVSTVMKSHNIPQSDRIPQIPPPRDS